MQDEERLQSAHDRLCLPLLAFGSEGHPEEVRDVAQFLIGLDDVFAAEHAQAGSSDGGNLAKDAMDVDVALLLRLVAELAAKVSRVCLWVTRGEACDQCLQHAHRVRSLQLLLLISFHEACKFRVDVVVGPNPKLEVLQLNLARELAIQEQKGGLSKVGVESEATPLARQLLDGVAAVLEDTFLAVDIADARDAVHRVHVGRVK
mmetsp:Transcript_46430/g.61497  ORF Transcript_46430/g.61497 Transcript_46430/m.61497 type:complete len:204 (-) Transcript_46430:1850-2461(-)|eukprot:CAMPEP_0185575020 /NCGR_PEP_ID=MMETSP0434-20130131/6328_1 /TAXON_ID=626734 ORGANISM="Favella taraikaensis, Strain Fe Narragansett Bay" /NCGR_SAMPLE_ID=MMETSP0434 /ASSEMBLY_ACC=CAM_ASM_000379 /LENGTH=203 /DNA_ID=CAMNT_0028191777 /DNA_START=1285 /DNA_END=1896 /DNA_ORIENTATION=-